jgi:primosomal protein N'
MTKHEDAQARAAVGSPLEPTVRQHTERAKRAAAVLADRGWSVTENDGVSCHKCGHDLMRDARYCYQCGEPVRNFTRGTLDDLEAAIAAAVDGVA